MVVSAGLKPERVLSKRNVDQSPEAAWAGWYLIRAREGPIPITHKMIAVRTNCDLSKRFMPVLLPYQDQEKTCYLSSVISLSDLILKGEMYIRRTAKSLQTGRDTLIIFCSSVLPQAAILELPVHGWPKNANEQDVGE